MHNRIKALIVAAMVITNTVSPTVEVLANEIDKESSEVMTNAMTIEDDESEQLEEEIPTLEENKSEKLIEASDVLTSDREGNEQLKENADILARTVKKLSIESNNGAFDWGYGTSNEVAILVEFDNAANKKKVVEIELPNDMAFDRYPVVGKPTDSVESEGTQTELAVIKDVLEKPTKDPITNQYNGKLIYELEDGVSSAKIVINVSVDRYRYYKPKEITNAIKVTVKEDDTEVRATSMNVQAVNNTKIGAKNNSLKHSSQSRTLEVQPGGTGNTYNYYRNTTSTVQTGDDGLRDFTLIRSAKLTMYYPNNTTLVDVNNLPTGATCDNYQHENKVVINMTGETISNSNISLTYKVDDTAQFGKLESPNFNTMEVEYYDGTKEILTASIKDSVEVVDPSKIKDVIKMSTDTGHYHDYNGESLSIGGYIYLKNQTVKEYKNQIFEYKFSKWNTRKVLLPESMTDIINIKYKLIGDNKEYSVANSELVAFQGEDRLIDADKLGVPDGQYFQEVTFEVERIPEGFNDTADGRYNKLAISFGELPAGVNEGSTTIRIYHKGDTPDPNDDIIVPIKRESKPEKIAISTGTTTLKNDSNLDVTNSFNQRVLKAKATFDANKGFTRTYNFSYYLENPEIIIRMPEGFHLSQGTIKLKQGNVTKNLLL